MNWFLILALLLGASIITAALTQIAFERGLMPGIGL